jgi:cysteine-rich repeat protein
VGGGGGTPAGAPDFDFTPEPDQAVAYQIDPMHSGAQLGTKIVPPLRQLWMKQFAAGVSYPVMADSRVFVSVNPTDGRDAPTVQAFDAASGDTLWRSEPIEDDFIFTPVHLAYDRGQLFAMNEGGNVVAFEPGNGGVRWHAQLEGVYGFGAMPIAAGGALFLAGAGEKTLFVLDERDGHVVYRGNAQGIGHPTLGGDMLFSSGGCHETDGMEARTGNVLWHYQEDCSGGGGERTVFHNGLLWVGDSGLIALDAKTGARVAELEAPMPFWQISAVGDDLVLPSMYRGNALEVFDAANGSLRWSVALPAFPVLPVLIAPGYAFVLGGDQSEDKYLYGFNLDTHERAWKSSEPAAASFITTGTEPFQAMAAAGGRIVVAYGHSLSAYIPASSMEPPPSKCGNFVVEGEEVCDDGNSVDSDYCSAGCDAVTGSCGDGIVQDNETCDDNGASCSDTCQKAYPGVMLAAGNNETCGLRADGSVRCWGKPWGTNDRPDRSMRYIGAYDATAAGLLTDSSALFWGRWSQLPPAAGPFLKLEPGLDSYCAIRTSGALECWKVMAPIPTGEFTELAAADSKYCALTKAGELSCFGNGAVLPWGGKYRSVAMGFTATCAIRDDRTLECSDNVEPPPGEFAAVTVGYEFQCGIRTSGEVACWGRLTGRGGSGRTLDPPSGKFALIDAGWQHVCGVRVDGTAVCWGANEDGQATAPADFP